MEVSKSGRALTVSDNGASFDYDGLAAALPSLLNPPTPESIAGRYLAVGLCGARSLGFKKASVRCPGATMLFTNDRLELSSEGQEERTTVEVVERRTMRDIVTDILRKQSTQEAREALHCFRFAPCRVRLNTERISEIHAALMVCCVKINSPPAPPAGFRPSEEALVQTELPISGWLTLSDSVEAPLTFVVHGIAFDCEDSKVAGLIFCDELQLDLSFQSLVNNELHSKIKSELPKLKTAGILKLLADPESLALAAELLASKLKTNEGKRWWTQELQRASFLGRSYEELKSQFLELGFLPISRELEPATDLLGLLFPSLIRWERIKLPQAREILLQGPRITYAPERKNYVLSFQPESADRPGECLGFGELTSLVSPDEGPYGFQVICINIERSEQREYYFLYSELQAFGEMVAQCVTAGLFPQERVRGFFLNLIPWLLSVRGGLSWRVDLRDYLVFERQDKGLVSYAEMRKRRVPYTTQDQLPSHLAHALRLSQAELALLQRLGDLQLDCAAPTMRQLEIRDASADGGTS